MKHGLYGFSSGIKFAYYKDDPKPEYAPKKKSVNKPRAARPPIVATIQRGIRPISLISIRIKD